MTLPSSWRKSSASANGQNCVEVSNRLDMFRDSKNPSKVLTVDVGVFVRMLRSG